MVLSEELSILASCLLRSASRNSVLEEFIVRRFAVTLNISTFIVDPDSNIVKDVDLPNLEKIRQSIMHVKVLVVRVCQL